MNRFARCSHFIAVPVAGLSACPGSAGSSAAWPAPLTSLNDAVEGYLNGSVDMGPLLRGADSTVNADGTVAEGCDAACASGDACECAVSVCIAIESTATVIQGIVD